MHLAFTVDTRAEVDTFYRAALDAGASSRESPGVHPEYHADYYGAFVERPARHQPRSGVPPPRTLTRQRPAGSHRDSSTAQLVS